jgi:septation ring formation regulator EzrA
MEARIAVIESDLRNVKENVAKLSETATKIGEAVTNLLTGQAELRGDLNTLRAEMNGRMEALEKKMIQWFVATAISCAGLAFSAAKLFA